MKYTLKKGLLGPKLVDESGNELDYNRKELKLKSSRNGFVFVSDNGDKTQNLTHLFQVTRTGYLGVSDDKSKCLVDIQNGNLTEPFVDYTPEFFATLDGRLKKYDKTLKVEDTGLSAVVEKSKYSDDKSMATTSFRDRRNSETLVVAKDSLGKFGVVGPNGVMCPFVFSSPEIKAVKEFSIYGEKKLFIFACDGQEVVVDNKGNVVDSRAYVGEYSQIYDQNGNEQYSTYDKKSDKSVIYEFDGKNGLNVVATLDGEVNSAYKNPAGGMVYWVDEKDGSSKVVDQEGKDLLGKKYDFVEPVSMSGVKTDVLFCVKNKTGKKDVHGYNATNKGVFSIAKGKEIVAPEFDDIDFRYSGVGADGLLKFFAKKGDWGVINENGQEEVEFSYKHTPTLTHVTRRIIKDENGRRTVEALEIKDKDGKKKYFNISQPNIVATEQEEKGVKEYRRMLDESIARDKAAEDARRNAEKARREAAARRAAHEEKTTRAAIGATLLTGSPIAGLIVKEIMDEHGPSNG